MLTLSEYTEFDGLALAALVSEKELTAEELLDAALRAVEVVNPQINCVAAIMEEQARRAISEGIPNGVFNGVPFLIKECMLLMEGAPYRVGSRLLDGYCAQNDTELMARFRLSGLVTFGTTPTPEIAYSPTTESTYNGPTRNPWSTDHSAGGSSGGAVAAVASGVVPIAHGNDGGGSIRIPAPCCGLIGLKPTRHRVPQGPNYGELLQGLSCEFVVSRTVRDTAAVLDAVAGPDPGAKNVIAPPARPYTEEITRPLEYLRIAVMDHSFSGTPVDLSVASTVREIANTCEDLGLETVDDAPEVDWENFFAATHAVWIANVAAIVEYMGQLVNRTPSPDLLETATWACYEAGKRLPATDLVKALDAFNVACRSVGRFFQRYDVLLTPTLARLPVPLGEINQNRQGITALQWTSQVFDWCNFTPLINTTGQPAISLPLGESETCLPIGVQFIGHMNDEATLLRLARQLEEIHPWRHRRPVVHAARSEDD